jgi:hypothetical protein
MGLLAQPVLADLDRVGGRRRRASSRQLPQCRRRHVLEFGRHRGADPGQRLQGRGIVVGRGQVPIGGTRRRRVGIGLEHGDPESHRLRRVHEHPAELAAAEHAEHRPMGWRTAVRCHGSCPVIASASAVWRRRNAASRSRTAASSCASIAAAKRAALAAPAAPIAKVATGIPRGIWTIE